MNHLPPAERLSEPPAPRGAARALAVTALSRLYLSDARTAAEPVVAESGDAHVVLVTPLLGDLFGGSTVTVSASATMQLE